MSYQALEEAFARPNLTISKLQHFRKEHLVHFCEVNSIDVRRKGNKEPTKAAYTTALFNTVSHYHDPRTHIRRFPETRRCRACINISLAENDEKTNQIRNIKGNFQHEK